MITARHWIIDNADDVFGFSFAVFFPSFILNVVDEEYNSKLLKTKWLPGGCILHKKENLVLNNYYEYKGKAYDEDLIHSFLLHNNSIDLCVSKKAFAKSINYHAYEHKNFNTLIKYLYRIYKIKVKLSRDSKGNIFYYHIWFFQWFCSETFRYLKTKFL